MLVNTTCFFINLKSYSSPQILGYQNCFSETWLHLFAPQVIVKIRFCSFQNSCWDRSLLFVFLYICEQPKAIYFQPVDRKSPFLLAYFHTESIPTMVYVYWDSNTCQKIYCKLARALRSSTTYWSPEIEGRARVLFLSSHSFPFHFSFFLLTFSCRL